MAAGNWIAYNGFREYVGDGTVDMDNDTFKVQLHSSTYTPNAETHDTTTDLSNEVANGNGYTTGGATLGSVTWTKSTTTVTFDSADPTWTASGGNIGPARYAVINDTTANKLIAYCDLGEDVTTLDGNTLTLTINASGILTLSGATS